MSNDELEAALDYLYGLPLGDFTTARDALVKQLREAGQKETAAEIRRLRKPTVPAWAVNQLARRHHRDLEVLLEARDAIRQAGSAGELRSLAEQRRQLVSRLVDHGKEILTAAGHAATQSHLELLRRTLEAGASEQERQLLLEGRLTRDLEPSGFEDALPFGVEPPEETDRAVQEQQQARITELEAAADAAEQEAHRLEQEATEAQREATTAQAAADRAARQAAEARRKAEHARQEARAAQRTAPTGP